MDRPTTRLSGVVLDTPEAQRLSRFYQQLLGWSIRDDSPEWVVLKAPTGETNLSFQTDPDYVRPTWPAQPGAAPMMIHLDIGVDDLEGAVAYVEQLGGELASYQPQEGVRVMFDPDGHPFCLFLPGH